MNILQFLANSKPLCSPYDFSKKGNQNSHNYTTIERNFKELSDLDLLKQHEDAKTIKNNNKTQYSLTILGFNEVLDYFYNKFRKCSSNYNEIICEGEQCKHEGKKPEYTDNITFIEEMKNYEDKLIYIIETQSIHIVISRICIDIIKNVTNPHFSSQNEINTHNINHNYVNLFQNRIFDEESHIKYFLYEQLILSSSSYGGNVEHLYNSDQKTFASYVFFNIIQNIENDTLSDSTKEVIILEMRKEKSVWECAENMIYHQILEHLGQIQQYAYIIKNKEILNYSTEIVKNIKENKI